MITLSSPLTTLPKAKLRTNAIEALEKLGVSTVRDLLFYFPYRYHDFTQFKAIKDLKTSDTVTIKGTIKSIASRFSFRGRGSLAEAVVSDDTGSIKIVWFNQGYLAKTLHPGDEVFLAGTLSKYKSWQMQNPVYEKVSATSIHTGRLVPVYHTTEKLYDRTLRSLVEQCLPTAPEVKEDLPEWMVTKFELMPLTEAVVELHFPTTSQRLKSAQKRVVFHEVLVQQLAVQLHRLKLSQATAPKIEENIELIKEFLTTLPFSLTAGQKRALWDAVKDMNRPVPMNRLLEGDVGSGKTLVALISCLKAASEGFQAVILAPTEILARQHYDVFRNYLRAYPYPVGLLTRNFQIINDQLLTKANLLTDLSEGTLPLLVATHAVLQQGVEFHKLGLVIIDEQHRFGVQQRGTLLKLKKGTLTPHLLSMSATPIPRTLALSVFSDLSISTLTELPKGRQKITSSIVEESGRAEAYEFIRKEVSAGRQAFVVTPRVEDSEASTIKSAKAEAERLQKEVFPKAKVGLVHGKLAGAEKERIMNAFNNKQIDILVATSVIEIGIDVPNATVMLIEDAERFGLAQLHQLRGRVGRGSQPSFCFLFTQSEDSDTLGRLREFTKISDGFKLAELDLKQRGYGSLFGSQQTGFDFKFSQYLTLGVLKLGQEAASELLKKDASLQKHPGLKKLVDPLLEQIHLE